MNATDFNFYLKKKIQKKQCCQIASFVMTKILILENFVLDLMILKIIVIGNPHRNYIVVTQCLAGFLGNWVVRQTGSILN